MAGVGYALFLISTFALQSEYLTGLGLGMIFYGFYFGVMSRDLVDFGGDCMAATIGVSSFKQSACIIAMHLHRALPSLHCLQIWALATL